MDSARAREQIARLRAGGLDSRTLRIELLRVIRRVVAFDAYAFLLTDPETSVGTSAVAEVPCLPRLPELIRLKYLTVVNRWNTMPSPVALLSAATRGDLSKSPMWDQLLRDYGVGDIASSVYRDRYGCWGFLDLWRDASAPPFDDDDVRFLHDASKPITTALRRAQADTFAVAEEVSQTPAGPVVLLMSPLLYVRAQTGASRSYLRSLMPASVSEQGPIPASCYNVAGQLLALEQGVDASPPLARVHLHGGTWLRIRAARIAAESSADPAIAATIESVGPRERLALFCRAHALTRRESELVTHLTKGADTRELAEQMFVSENTVQDHLKSIFVKTGTRSRRALLAKALGG